MTAKKSYSTQLSFFQKQDSSITQADVHNAKQLSILDRNDDLSNQWQPLDTLALEIPYISQLEPLLEVVGGINSSSNQEPLIAARSRLGRILIDLYRIGESPPSRESWEKDSHSEEFKDAILLALIKGLAYNNKNNEIEDRDLRIRNDLRYQRVSDRIIRKLDGSYSIVTVTGSIRQIDTQTAEILMNFTEMDYLILQTIAVNLLESPDPIPLRSGIAEELIDTLHTLYQLAKSEDLPDEMFEARGLLLSSKRYFKILFCSDEFRSLDVYDTKYKNIPITIWIDEVIKNGVAFEGILNQNLRERSRLQLEINRYINSGFGRAIEEIVIDRIVEFTEENESDEQLEREGKNSSGLHTDQFQKFEGMHSQAVADCAKKVLITYAQRIITQSDSDLLPFYIDPSFRPSGNSRWANSSTWD